MSNFIVNFLLRFLMNVLNLLSFSKTTITNSLNVNIKTNTGDTMTVNLDPKWDIKNVKEIVGPQLGIAPDDMKIIFAGKELNDCTVIEECDLGVQSILHVVCGKKKYGSISEGSKPLCETLVDLQLSGRERSSTTARRAQFYVYCGSPCKSLQSGKLRVRCSTCRSGAFTVDRDPNDWADVLKPHRITGVCELLDCEPPGEGLHYAEFFFKCSRHATQGEDDMAVALHLIKSNIHAVPCLACFEISDPVLVFPCTEGHVTCIQCFRDYCSTLLRDRMFRSHPEHGYTVACPAGCEDSLITEIHHFKLLTEQQYAQYQRFAAEEYVLQSGGVFCPQPGCGMGILVDPECRRVTCLGGCGYVFCRQCLNGYHMGECVTEEEAAQQEAAILDFSVDRNRAAQARWDTASKTTIRVISKPCPKCRTPTERDGGCMHMVCSRQQCGLHWCWICQAEWTRDCMTNHWFA